jgi:hypothetical protein
VKCDQVYLHICDNLDQKIDSPKCREIKKHIQACPDCQAYLDSLKKTVAIYRALPVPQLSKKAHRDLFSTIRVMTRGSGKRNLKTK